jgi:RNA polymerase sigma factor (sigma-70 family)
MKSGEASQSHPSSGGIFPQTRWSMVIAAIDKDDAQNPGALEELCKIYWKPIYLFIRSRGHSPAESEDLTQEFFYRLLTKEFLNRVEGPEKGRMRSFLCVLLKRFLADEYDKTMTIKRGGNWQAIPIDGSTAEALLAQARPDNQSPDLLFDRQWALDLLAQTLKILHHDYIAAGRAELFDKLKPTISLQFESPPYHQLAKELGLTEGALKVAVHRFRKRYRDCLHATLRDTLETPEEADEELRYLLSLFTER